MLCCAADAPASGGSQCHNGQLGCDGEVAEPYGHVLLLCLQPCVVADLLRGIDMSLWPVVLQYMGMS